MIGKWVADERQGRGTWTSLTGGSYDVRACYILYLSSHLKFSFC